MDLQLANQLQHEIANLMWEAETNEEVSELITKFGHDAMVVYHMMVAATFDDVEDVFVANHILKDIFSK